MYLGVGKAALDFGLDRVRSLVSMVTDIFHSVIIGLLAHMSRRLRGELIG